MRGLATGCGYVEQGQEVQITLDCGAPEARRGLAYISCSGIKLFPMPEFKKGQTV